MLSSSRRETHFDAANRGLLTSTAALIVPIHPSG